MSFLKADEQAAAKHSVARRTTVRSSSLLSFEVVQLTKARVAEIMSRSVLGRGDLRRRDGGDEMAEDLVLGAILLLCERRVGSAHASSLLPLRTTHDIL